MNEMSDDTKQISTGLEDILKGSKNVDSKSNDLVEVIDEVHEYFRALKTLSRENSSLFE
jgi:methyl-accepting chemotaxis protein